MSMMSPPVRSDARSVRRRSSRRAPGVGLLPARQKLGLRQVHPVDGAERLGDLGRAHLRKILFLKDLLVGDGQAQILLLVLRRLRHPRLRHRLLHAARARLRLLLGLLRQRHRIQHVLPFLRGAEEQVEGLLEDQRMFVALDEDRLQRGEDVGAVADVNHLERIHGIDHRARPDGNAGGTQRAGEADDVVGELLGLLRGKVVDGHGSILAPSFRGVAKRRISRFRVRCCASPRNDDQFSLVASFSTFCKASPCIRVMSS
ncbi:hypothetical protein ABIG06_007502 [Bradyrhizobium sp. USDA 326]